MKYLKLSSGGSMPMVGYGTWQVSDTIGLKNFNIISIYSYTVYAHRSQGRGNKEQFRRDRKVYYCSLLHFFK